MRWLAFALIVSCLGEGHEAERATSFAEVVASAAPKELPRDERLIPGKGVELFVRTAGPETAKSTVIVLHGGPGHSHDYLRGIEVLASERRRVVLFDQRGAGRSTAPRRADGAIDLRKEAWSVDAFMADIDAVRAHAKAARVHLIGFSWGGILAMAYALEHPSSVASLVLVGTGEPGPTLGAVRREAYRRRFRELKKQGLLPKDFPDDCTSRMTAKLPMFFADARHPAIAKPTGSVCTDGAARASWNGFGDRDLTPELHRITTPTLIFHGRSDYISSSRVASEIQSRMRGSEARVVIKDGCGHRVLDECPRAFFDALLAFWSEPPLAAARFERPPLDRKTYAARKKRAMALERDFERAFDAM